ncbi:transketolase [Sandaracinobacteroides saxicola]|uniref:Transketolase n=1 Tax=Sandaracinobacteroides saxicola TaxID=2759707 RepID=A0A7G5IK73_9SPHN|nr:transketolase [Sandaracinobacteroides saxicola]QMW23765.1 transketolase [Sandaracinobacteroides saxicola]
MTMTNRSMANAIRALAMDAVEAANSGHPGMPMGMADAATVLFRQYLKFDANAPDWPDRDRFVLSAGHGSMLIYALLHLTGYARPTIDDIRRFRQLGSPCAGHPENFELAGVECTTGPLGQGLAMAVGMAMAERHLNAVHGDALVDHRTWVIAGDGCLMEGVSQEAIGIAGHHRLGRLNVLWDDNRISIDGPTSLSTSEDMAGRFAAAGWHVVACDGHDDGDVARALAEARDDERPSLIACRTTIGYGAPTKAGSKDSHGAALGAAEIAATRVALGWHSAPFEIPDDIAAAWRAVGARGAGERQAWEARAAGAEGAALKVRFGAVPDAGLIDGHVAALLTNPAKVATRKASEMALGVLTEAVPAMVGGSADLTGSNNTKTAATKPFSAQDYGGRYVYWGVREFGMAAAMNGLALHGGIIPYGGTFLVFSDYMRNAIRMSALQRVGVVYVLTHDSIGLGEDGPTHQPVEHLMSLRAMPNLAVYRPADAVETAECWALALADRTRPSVLALSRQNLPQLRVDAGMRCATGGYRLVPATAPRRVVLVATGSEVAIAADTAKLLEAQGIGADVVSLPCWERLMAQPWALFADLFPADVLKVSIEAGATLGWERIVGTDGMTFGIDSFGASAPIEALYEHFGLTPANIAAKVGERLKERA